jgi:hypothetical protein
LFVYRRTVHGGDKEIHCSFFFRLMVMKLSRCLVNVVVVVMCVLCRVDIQAKFEGEEEKENVGRLSKW